VLYHTFTDAKFGGYRNSAAAGAAKNVEFSCVFVRHAFERQSLCARFRHEGVNDFDALVCSCAPVFNFIRLLPIGDTTKCRSPKNGKDWGFPQPQEDRINRSRRNFAGKRIPWVCYRTPNLAIIGKRESVQELPKMSQFAENCVFGHRKPTQ